MLNKINSLEEYKNEYEFSIQNPELFWAKNASKFYWYKKWDRILDWNFSEPNVQWFQGGKLNITENCIDRHLKKNADKVAIKWVPNNIEEQDRSITYRELHQQVSKFSNVLLKNGAKKGDRICLYLPMVPELAIAVLACARIGAIHSVVFAGFSSKSLSDRINDASCNIVITADGSFRGEKTIALKNIVDDALHHCHSVEKVVVLKRTKQEVNFEKNRDVWWHEEMNQVNDIRPAEVMNSEDPLFVLYTSGSTGKPKGVVHSIGGYMVYAEYSFRNVFQYENDDIYWCTADIGWITGHSYIIYGPLLAGATTLMFEGIPTYPDAGRFWQIIDKYKVNIFYTAPTAIRMLQAKGDHYVDGYKLDSLKVIGSVGEPINEEAWHWYHKKIGKEKCPVVDTWWQTETGGILIAPLAGITPLKPTFASLPLPGIQPCLVDNEGNEILENNKSGNLCIKFPWPSMIRTTYGNHDRCKNVYFSTFPNKYFTGDGSYRDEQGFYRITGRVDDVMNVSGHRIGTAEVEDAINTHDKVVESAVVSFPHPIKGQGIYAYVICEDYDAKDEEITPGIISKVSDVIGPIAKPDKIQIVKALPKTRSGKIMRRILRKLANSEYDSLGDVSTLLDPSVIDDIKAGLE